VDVIQYLVFPYITIFLKLDRPGESSLMRSTTVVLIDTVPAKRRGRLIDGVLLTGARAEGGRQFLQKSANFFCFCDFVSGIPLPGEFMEGRWRRS
jgi:hypothetical protein